MAKRKRRGRRKGSRKHAMPHKKRRRGRRARNATLGAGAQIALGVGGYMTAGLLGTLAQAYLLSATSSANTIRLTRSAIGAVGALGTAMLVGEPTMSGPLATGMAANAGVQILGVGADAAGITVSNKKFMGLAPGSTASAGTPGSGAAVRTGLNAIVPRDASGKILTVVTAWDASKNAFIAPDGSELTSLQTISAGGHEAFVATDPNSGLKLLLIDANGNPWKFKDGAPVTTDSSVVGLSGTFPPWAGYPGYDKRRFPQQTVSLPAQIAPHVQGYANYAPAMSGYANFAPAMAGWDPGYGG